MENNEANFDDEVGEVTEIAETMDVTETVDETLEETVSEQKFLDEEEINSPEPNSQKKPDRNEGASTIPSGPFYYLVIPPAQTPLGSAPLDDLSEYEKLERVSFGDFVTVIVPPLDGQGKITYRTNADSAKRIRKWIQEYGIKTNTNWVVRNVYKPKRYLFNYRYVCHLGPHNKNLNTTKRNFECRVSMTVKVKKNTPSDVGLDPFLRLKVPLRAEIIVEGTHTHSTNSATNVKLLRTSDKIRQCFIKYFEQGVTRTLAKKMYSCAIQMDGPIKEANNNRGCPSSSTIDWWFRYWRMSKMKEKQEENSENESEVDESEIAVEMEETIDDNGESTFNEEEYEDDCSPKKRKFDPLTLVKSELSDSVDVSKISPANGAAVVPPPPIVLNNDPQYQPFFLLVTNDTKLDENEVVIRKIVKSFENRVRETFSQDPVYAKMIMKASKPFVRDKNPKSVTNDGILKMFAVSKQKPKKLPPSGVIVGRRKKTIKKELPE